MKNSFARMIATFFYSGNFPKAPGTMGSVAACIPLALHLWLVPDHALWPGLVIGLLISLTLGIWATQVVIDLDGIKDPGYVVIDEAAGIWITFLFIPYNSLLQNPWLLLVGFALFRFFDILKPLGIHQLEKLPGAWGVMADDLLGGVYAGVVLLFISSLL